MFELRLDRLIFGFEQFDSSFRLTAVVAAGVELFMRPGPLTHTPVVDVVDVPMFFIRNVMDELSGMLAQYGLPPPTTTPVLLDSTTGVRSHECILADFAVTILVDAVRRSPFDRPGDSIFFLLL